LQEDGRKSFTDISQETGMSVGAIRNRYNKLLQENVLHIIGWTDPVKAGFNSYSRVNISIRPTELINEVANQLVSLAPVTFVGMTSGNYDIEVNLLCKDNAELLEVMHEQIHKIQGVYETHTTIYLKVLKWASHNVGEVISKKALENSEFVKAKK